ncbi:NUDIX hydrolase [Patescibacteria group bacterium]|nr:NUDIX hydrolase [Patescibacteria group bacterium]
MTEKTKGVAVSAMLWRDGKFLLLKRNQQPLQWGPPAGEVLNDENPIDAVLRETMEEAGIKVKVLMPVAFWYGRHDGTQLISISFLCEYVSGEVKLSDEHNDAKWLTTEEMVQEEMTHDIKDFVRAKVVKQLFDAGKIE